MTINEMCEEMNDYAGRKGFWPPDDPDSTIQNVSLLEGLQHVHDEVDEAIDEVKRGNMETYILGGDTDGVPSPHGFPSEIADAVMILMSICGQYNIDLEKEMLDKHAYNETRPYRHGR